MDLRQLLNPTSDFEDVKFANHLLSLKRQRSCYDDDHHEDYYTSSKTSSSFSSKKLKLMKHENLEDINDDDEEEMEEIMTSSSINHLHSSPFFEKLELSPGHHYHRQQSYSSADDFSESNDESEDLSSSTSQLFPIKGAKSSPSELHEMKLERIVHKAEKVLRQLPSLQEGFPSSLGEIIQEISKNLKTIPALKIRKRTVNQTTAVVVYCTLKQLNIKVTVENVIEALKRIEKSHSLSRSSKPNYARNNSELLGISKLISSMEGFLNNQTVFSAAAATATVSSPAQNAAEADASDEGEPVQPASCNSNSSNNTNAISHAQSTQEATKKLCRDLALGAEVEAKATEYAGLSEDSALASRHDVSIAASCVLLAAKSFQKKLTLTRVSEASGVSGCTIRKAQKALAGLLGKESHEE